MIVAFPQPGSRSSVTHKWPLAEISRHSPEFARHYGIKAQDVLWADLTLESAADGQISTVSITGSVGFEPNLACGRCLKRGPLTVTADVDVSVRLAQHGGARPAGHQLVACDMASDGDSKESGVELESEFLDVYEVQDEEINLLQIAIDAVDLAVPEPVSFRDDSGHCGLCHETIGDSLVASGGDPDATNPFAALKGLKDKLKN